MEYTPKQLREKYLKLPQDLKDAMSNIDVSGAIRNIGKKNNLTIDKIGDLGNETGMVMLGVTHPNEFISNLASRLEVDKEVARNIANDINEQIFKPVRDSLRKIHNIRDDSAKVSPLENLKDHQGESLMENSREDILKEIEKEHATAGVADKKDKEEMPAIMRGTTESNPFDAKMGGEIHIASTEEKTVEPALPEKPKNKYPELDPYREPIE